jgi:ribosomal protein S18 acetylase RimI-like enzyme
MVNKLQFKIRRLTAKDAKILQKLDQAIYGLEKHPHLTNIDRIKTMLKKKRDYYIVAFVDNKAVGWVIGNTIERFTGKEMLLYEIDVLSDYRRQGIATALIGYLKHMCKKKGYEEMWVLTDNENSAALKTYISAGGKREALDLVMLIFDKF